jgi:N-acetylneuraminic acid mutarotase
MIWTNADGFAPECDGSFPFVGRKHFRVVASLLSCLLCLGGAPAGWAAGTWEQKADLPVPTAGLHATTLGERIVVVGGQNWNDSSRPPATGNLWSFDPKENRWTARAPMPTGRVFLDTAVVDGKLYAIGGTTFGEEQQPGLAVVEVYDPDTDTWTRKADMPTPRADLTVSAVNGRIYAIGGTRTVGVDSLPTVEEYDPNTNTWTRKADMPTPRLHLTSAVVDGKIYVFGGSPEWAFPLSAAEMYDPETNTWTKVAHMPTERTGLWAATLNGRIYVMGGFSWESKALATVEAYDPATNTWSKLPDMLTPRVLFAATAASGEIYAIGGSESDFTCLTAVEAFRPE